MKKDKITDQVINTAKIIEANEQGFTERKRKLLEKYREIYLSEDITYEDLIARKSFLMNSRKYFLSIFLTLALGLFVTYAFNALNIVLPTNTFLQIAANFLWVSFMITGSYFLSEKLSNIIYVSDGRSDRYNTIEFEIKLIDSILEEQFHYEDTITDIVNTRFYKQTVPSNANGETAPSNEETEQPEEKLVASNAVPSNESNEQPQEAAVAVKEAQEDEAKV